MGGASRGAAISLQRQSGDHSLRVVWRDGGTHFFLLKHTMQTKAILLFRGRLHKLGLLTKIFYWQEQKLIKRTQGVVNLLPILALANLLMSAMIMLSTTQYAEYLEYREQERERESSPSTKHSSYKSPRRQHTFIYISQVWLFRPNPGSISRDMDIFPPKCPCLSHELFSKLHSARLFPFESKACKYKTTNPSFEFLTHRAYSNHHKNPKLSMLLFTKWSKTLKKEL